MTPGGVSCCRPEDRPAQPGRASVLVAALALVVLVAACRAAPPPPTSAPAPGCLGAMASQIDGDVSVQACPRGALLAWTDGEGLAVAALWFGFRPAGDLVSTWAVRNAAPELQAVRIERLRAAEARLEAARDLRGCAPLQASADDIGGVGVPAVEAATRAVDTLPAPGPTVAPAAALPPAGPEPPGATLRRLSGLAALLALCLYALLQAASGARALRREPRDALLALGVTGFAVALRFFVSPRLPMIAQFADLAYLNGALDWLRDGARWSPGGYPPGFTALLFGVFGAVRPSFEAAFAVTTVVGGLLALPAFAVGRRLGGSRLAGLLAGLAASTLPMSVVFSNGVMAEAAAAYCVAATFQHALAWLDDERPADALRLVLALFLFAEMRPEGLLEVPALLAVLAALLPAAGKARRFLLDPYVRWGVAGALVLGGPFLLLTVAHVPAQHAGEARRALLNLLWVVPGLLLLGFAGRRLAAALRDRPATHALVAAGLAAAAAVWARTLLAELGPSILAPEWSPRLTLDPNFIHAPVLVANYGFPDGTRLDDPWIFPVAWLVPAALGLLPSRRAQAHPAAPAAAPGFAALAAFWWLMASTCMAKSGELIAEGTRYMLPAAGLIALVVAMGAQRAVELVPRTRPWGWLAGALAALWMLSPLATHRAILTDRDFDQQRRYRFVRQAFPALPDDALLLLPDHLIYSENQGAHGGLAHLSSRTPSLCATTSALFGRPRACLGLRQWAARAFAWSGPVVLFLDLDCYATLTGAEDPLCAELRSRPGLVPLARERFAPRPWGRYPLPAAPSVEIALLAVPPADAAALRARIAEADRAAGSPAGTPPVEPVFLAPPPATDPGGPP